MDAQRQKFIRQIRAAGLRVTGPRLAVLGTLRRSGRPLSHGEVVEALDGKGFDRATLYRNLHDLADASILTRSDLGAVWRFELATKGQDRTVELHPHFVCTECGAVSCLPGAKIDVTCFKPAPRALAAGHFEVQLRGVCDGCAGCGGIS